MPYEKGSHFLFYLETKLGGAEKMDGFLKAYVKRFSYKSIVTADFKEFVYEYFADQKAVLDQIEWEAWFSAPGMPLKGNAYVWNRATSASHALARCSSCAPLTSSPASARISQLRQLASRHGRPTCSLVAERRRRGGRQGLQGRLGRAQLEADLRLSG